MNKYRITYQHLETLETHVLYVKEQNKSAAEIEGWKRVTKVFQRSYILGMDQVGIEEIKEGSDEQ